MIERTELLELVPHQGKMLLLSRITSYDLEKWTIHAEFDSDASCLFYDPLLGGVPAWVSFECIAQAVSALSGLAARRAGRRPNIGIILSVANLEVILPVIPSRAFISAEERARLEAIRVFNGAVYAEDQTGRGLAARSRLTVMEVERFQDLLPKGGVHGAI